MLSLLAGNSFLRVQGLLGGASKSTVHAMLYDVAEETRRIKPQFLHMPTQEMIDDTARALNHKYHIYNASGIVNIYTQSSRDAEPFDFLCGSGSAEPPLKLTAVFYSDIKSRKNFVFQVNILHLMLFRDLLKLHLTIHYNFYLKIQQLHKSKQ